MIAGSDNQSGVKGRGAVLDVTTTTTPISPPRRRRGRRLDGVIATLAVTTTKSTGKDKRDAKGAKATINRRERERESDHVSALSKKGAKIGSRAPFKWRAE